MSGKGAFTRASKRSLRRGGLTWPKAAGIAVALAALIVGLAVGVSRYRLAQAYRQYPLRYKDTIVSFARAYDLEPWHVAAVVRCESSFDPNAVSGVGARGLMQIMPETGRWLAGKFFESDTYTDDLLFDPKTNLRYGCWYLNWLMDRYHRDILLTTCAYHAGQGTVDEWLARSDVSPDGVTISADRIPFDSTRQYVKRVLTACEKYEELYDFEPQEAS